MIGTPCEYVAQHYRVPACIGRRVVASGKPGTIVEDRGHYIGVMLDGERRVGSHHPTWEMQYGEMAEKMPKAPKRTNFDAYQDECECYEGFAHFLGINIPQFQLRLEDDLVRMVRYHRGTFYSRWPERERKLAYLPDKDVEVAGEWMATKGEAKASYKQALAEYRAKGREHREAA